MVSNIFDEYGNTKGRPNALAPTTQTSTNQGSADPALQMALQQGQAGIPYDKGYNPAGMPAQEATQEQGPTQTAASTQTSAPSTPVSATGGIPPSPTAGQPPAPAAAPPMAPRSTAMNPELKAQTAAPAQQPAAPAQPPTPDPFASIGGGVFVNGGWIPASNTTAIQQAQQAAGTLNATYTSGAPIPNVPNQPPPPATTGATLGYGPNLTSPARPGDTNYVPGAVTQYTAPNNASTEAATMNLVNQMLANPHSMTDLGVNQMNEAQKEMIAQNLRQTQDLGASQAASRGFLDSGYQGSVNARNNTAANQALLASQRDTAIKKMLQDRADEIAAVNAGQTALTGAAGRAESAYKTGLTGEMAREGNAQTGAQSNLQNYLADLQAWENANAAANAQRQMSISEALGQGQLGLGQAQLRENASQFDANNQFNWARLLAEYNNPFYAQISGWNQT